MDPIEWGADGDAWVDDVYLQSHQPDDHDVWEVFACGDVDVDVRGGISRDLAARAVVAAVNVLRGER